MASSFLFCYKIHMLPITIRKRTITANELRFIKEIVNKNWDKGRTNISKVLCKEWNWRQPNGSLKDMACRELLLRLKRRDLLELPPSKSSRRIIRRKPIEKPSVDESPISGRIDQLPPISIQMVRWTRHEPLWNSLVHYHHYQSYSSTVGQHLKYIVWIDKNAVACLGWGSASWSVKSRDLFIGWNKSTKEKNLHLVINNTRFLILPWVSVKHLASKILALNAKKIFADWLSIYKHPVYLLETFIEKDRFRGTCYKAANWIHVGQTKGTSKKGNNHLFHGNIKDVYLYPLRKDFRLVLNSFQYQN
ncbi:MAG: hypothetical protein SCARUB_02108 [Candidatus Scalindua rubra]|uniref:Uncharacterized protein n=2 Tax=Candidatus Scalindua rubra TaxID=1872076 RepID=A0A1E3XB10_9BACT|nr:MAG: hypothetical protein SCARUB_02108 [Candidatus Scalindua rubra]